MKRTSQPLVLALLAATLALSGCKSMPWSSDSRGSSSSAGSTGSSSQSGSTQDEPLRPDLAAGQESLHENSGQQASQAQQAPNATVLAIEQAGASLAGDTAIGATGTAGATGSSQAGYRITVRLDDGSTQVINHTATPDFRSGERVHVANGAIVR